MQRGKNDTDQFLFGYLHDIEALEKVQKKATKILKALKNLSYSERLKICPMTTLHYRRIRGEKHIR